MKRMISSLCIIAAGFVWSITVVPYGAVMQSGKGKDIFLNSKVNHVVSDENGCVYVDGERVFKYGSLKIEKTKRPFDQPVIFDGKDMFLFKADCATVFYVGKDHEGFMKRMKPFVKVPHYTWTWQIAPASCDKGWCGKVKMIALDRKKKEVVGWDRDGKELGAIIKFNEASWAKHAVSIGFLQETGDILIGTMYPESKVHRFASDGREVIDSTWPRQGWAFKIVNVNGKTWGLHNGVFEIPETLTGGKPKRLGGALANQTTSLAWNGRGYFLATTQGLLYDDGKGDLKRWGGTGKVTALALLDGKVYAVSGTKINATWLDALPDEPFLNSMEGAWLVGGRWTGVVDAAEVRDSKILFSFENCGDSFYFDPRVTEWIHRKNRMVKTKDAVATRRGEAVIGAYKAVADGERISLFDANGKKVYTIKEPATLLASEGEWLIAYVPEKSAVLRYKIRN